MKHAQYLSVFFGLSLMISCTVAPDLSAEQAAIHQLIDRWNEAIVGSDVETITGLYAGDGYLMPPNAPRVAGLPAIRDAWIAMLETPGFSLIISAESIEISGAADIAYDVGTYQLGTDGPDGRIDDVGKYVVVWVKTEDGWRVAADIFNSDLPLK